MTAQSCHLRPIMRHGTAAPHDVEALEDSVLLLTIAWPVK
jgi:hypothetical protein